MTPRLITNAALAAFLAVALCACRSGGGGGNDAPFGGRSEATSKQVAALIDEMRFMHGHELLNRMQTLAGMGEDAGPELRAAMSSDDGLVRASTAWILGAVGDRRNIPALRTGLDDATAPVRYQAASSLVKLGDSNGFAVLVEGLADPEIELRYRCFQALQGVTGRDHGYRHDAPAEKRREATARWREWLQGVQASAL